MFASKIKRLFFFSRQEEIMQVNSLNQRIGKISRKGITQESYFRTANVYVFNPEGKIYVQKRSSKLIVYPGYLDLAPGGVVRINETDIEAAQREISEEMGLEVENLKKLATFSIEDNGWFWFCAFFRGEASGNPAINDDVESVNLMTLGEIKERVQKGDVFTPASLKGLKWLEKNSK